MNEIMNYNFCIIKKRLYIEPHCKIGIVGTDPMMIVGSVEGGAPIGDNGGGGGNPEDWDAKANTWEE